jgi:hypothetical protein
MKLTITATRKLSGMMWGIIERIIRDALTASGIRDVEIKLDATR